ncbi:hypothetical protein GQ43DRAFT_435527 [Delitschia confertaspora ATCC 74209]|uniref:PAC domain-containing protein n=1 Tax=Delitschia confertaspora ATCC 74209 TaxID=1513339 RepID=A0A9P4JD08_9PLEO|nr:hypothetical protein GQ43DRAFT_435527 [Delitschia confertaspora ATCC 74209]
MPSPFRKPSPFKRRSTHGSHSQYPTISAPRDFVKLSGMGSVTDPRPTTADSVRTDPGFGGQFDHHAFTQAGAVGESSVHNSHDVQARTGSLGSLPLEPRTPPIKSPKRINPLRSNPVLPPEDAPAPPPPDFSHRGIHIPTRTSSKCAPKRQRALRSASHPVNSMPTTPESRGRSSADSFLSYETSPSTATNHSLTPQQTISSPINEADRLSPLLEDDPQSFDLVAPNEGQAPKLFSLERRAEQLFSREYLEAIFHDTTSLLRFTSFLSVFRPNSVPVLIYYLDALKALRAINYANAIAEALEPLENHEFTHNPPRSTVNAILEDKARQAFDVLVCDDLPAFITHIFIQVVNVNIQKRITGILPPHLREASEGLAEVFCLTDPSRPDNPIIFASEEFHRTTQYGVGYAIGRNCRFLQGPRTNQNSIRRLGEAVAQGKEYSEVLLNYRRDGSPFMNLLTLSPLLDSQGKLRYYIGAQVDVSSLVKDCTELPAFRAMLDREDGEDKQGEMKDEFQSLCEMFNMVELDTVRRYGGSMHRELVENAADDAWSIYSNSKPQSHLRLRAPHNSSNNHDHDDPPQIHFTHHKPSTRFTSVYKSYLILRPHPSLRILFTSPSLRVPGVLQSRFLDRIGGSTRVRDSLAEALADGSRGVTAKIRWLSSPSRDGGHPGTGAEEGRPRWIHCTPLRGRDGEVGVWIVILVDDEDVGAGRIGKMGRVAPPVPSLREIRRASEASSLSRASSRADFSDEEGDAEYEGQWRRRSLRHSVVDRIRGPEMTIGGDLRRHTVNPGAGSNGNGNGNGNGMGRPGSALGMRRPGSAMSERGAGGRIASGAQSVNSFAL